MVETECLSKTLISQYYDLHREELVGYVLSRTGDAYGSEDIVQDVFLRLLQTGECITPVTLPCLVYTMIRNKTVDYWRHRAIRERGERLMVSGYMAENEVVGPDVIYSVADIERTLEQGMARLTNPQRLLYRMNVVDGIKIKKISEMTDQRYKHVENLICAARKNIRSYMRKMLA